MRNSIIKAWISEILDFLGDLFIGFLIFMVIVLLIACIPMEKYSYEYIDLDNNKGTAKKCSYKFRAYKLIGQSSPVCVLDDGTVKQVKEYKRIYEGSYKPIDCLFKE